MSRPLPSHAGTWLTLMALLVLVPGLAVAQVTDERVVFESCTILYQAGDYENASVCYRSLLDSGVHNGTLHADYANALLHLDRHGEAVYHYRQAQVFRPRNSEIRGALTHARDAAGLEGDPPRPPITRVVFFYDMLSPGELWAITAALNALLWILLGVRLFRRGEIATWAAVVAALGLALFGTTAVARTMELITSPSAVVLSGTAVARSARDRAAAEMFRLDEGSEVRVSARQGDWIAVRDDHDRRGWIEASLLGVIEYRAAGGVGTDREPGDGSEGEIPPIPEPPVPGPLQPPEAATDADR